MGPLNEFQRRFLDVTQQNRYLLEANIGGGPPEYFGYPLVFGSATNVLANGVNFQGSIAIQSDAWFLWEYLSVGYTIPATPTIGGPDRFSDPGNLLFQATITGTGDELLNVSPNFSGVPAVLAAGAPSDSQAGVPVIFPTPILLPPNSNINVTVQKYGTNAGADNPDLTGAYLMIHGVRVQVWS